MEVSLPFTGSFDYDCDSFYAGLKGFCLEVDCPAMPVEYLNTLVDKKKGKKLYCTIDRYFHNSGVKKLDEVLGRINKSVFDGFIVSDIGVIETVRRNFPDSKLILSSFGNCLNHLSAKVFYDLGFSRVILGHEIPVKDIDKISAANPSLELEIPVYGTMCMSYSGRSLLSTHFGEKGNIPDNLALEEEMRKGLFYPVRENDGFITIFSSKQLCITNRLEELINAGVTVFRAENPNADEKWTVNAIAAIRDRSGKESGTSEGFLLNNGPIDL